MRPLLLLGFLFTLLGGVISNESLRDALEAVQQRQRDLDTNVYYPRIAGGDGQPEDIGYGFQKSVAPNTAGVFEPMALPSSELGNQESGEGRGESGLKALERLMLDYLEEAEEGRIPREREYSYVYPTQMGGGKRSSVFREREDSGEPLQRLYETEGKEDFLPNFYLPPSSFRERMTGDGRRGGRPLNPGNLLRSYAGLNRGYEEGPEMGNEDDQDDDDEYLNFLNALIEKYKGEGGEEDSEELSDAEIQEVLEYLGKRKDERKRQYGYDFFNSPLAWVKRSSKRDLEEERGYGQEVAFDDRYRPLTQKRYPIAKRSSGKYLERRKKSAKETDPKVAEELNDIFSGVEKKPSLSTPKPTLPGVGNETNNKEKKPAVNKNNTEHKGQKERASDEASPNKPLELKKKSINWSDYFGIDKRRKKSGRSEAADEWLLDQYLKAYSLGKDKNNKGMDNSIERKSPENMDAKLRAMEDLIVDQALKYTGAHEGTTDSKEIQQVKDRVMSQLAAAYSLEKMRRALGEFRSSLAAQKATAPISHSIQLNKSEKEDEKSKRVAVKKEKVGVSPVEARIEKKQNALDMTNMIHDSDRDYDKEELAECPILQELESKCSQIGIISGDKEEIFTPLCMLHQICYICGPEVGGSSPRGCDGAFLSEARSVCEGSRACSYVARRTLATLREVKGGGEITTLGGCSPRTQSCLARFSNELARRR